MTPESVSNFLTAYIRSLREESRKEAKGPQFGFDRIIHELALSEDLIPLRLSFYREGEGELSRPKKEAEHGVDQSFLSRDGERLTVFVLKDEVLTYRKWITEKFEDDLRRARDQDLTAPELLRVKDVLIVLAYNKDEDEEGVESFEKLVRASNPTIAGRATLRFERWNLTTITEKVREKLLTPSLLPESFFHSFTYLCWQVADFSHGSPQWREVLIPDWREFLSSVLAQPVSERSVRLISVALIVLKAHGDAGENEQRKLAFQTGWLELVEWAMLALWDAARQIKAKEVHSAVFQIWCEFYLLELERFYENNIELLATEHSLEIRSGGVLQEAASSYLAYWHLGRLGILAMALSELRDLLTDNEEQMARVEAGIVKVTDWIVRHLNANSGCQRPLLDIQHIEIFLVWRTLAITGRWNDMLNWFHDLFERLLFRRLGKAGCRIIDTDNSWEGLFEYLATGEEPHAGFGKSSYLLLMLLELCLTEPEGNGNGLLTVIYRQLILGENAGGPKFPFKQRLELMGWGLPADWHERILREPVRGGVSLPVYFTAGEGELALPRTLRAFVDNSRKAFPLNLSPGVLASAMVLACIKHISPLPSDFWRTAIPGVMEVATESSDALTDDGKERDAA